MNQPHSCPDNCSTLRIIYTPLALPESCGDGRDSEYTPGLCSGGRLVYRCPGTTMNHKHIYNLETAANFLILKPLLVFKEMMHIANSVWFPPLPLTAIN